MSHSARRPRRDPYYPPQYVLSEEICPACGKLSYGSRHAAEAHIKRLDRDNKRRGRRDSRMRAYSCAHGNGWHLAHALSQGQRTGSFARVPRESSPQPQFSVS